MSEPPAELLAEEICRRKGPWCAPKGRRHRLMVSDEFLKIVRCPIAKEPLRCADEKLLSQLRLAAAQGNLVSRSGDPVDGPLEAGLVNQSDSYFYRLVDGIPNLMADDAVPLGQLQRTDKQPGEG